MNIISRWVLLIAVGLAIMLGAGCTAEARRHRQLAQAAEDYRAGRLDTAELEYINVLESQSTNPDAMAGLAVIYFDQGRIGRVYTYLKKAEELQPKNLAVRNRLASVYIASGKLKEAREEAKFVLEQQPADADAPLRLAEASATAADIEESRRLFKALPAAGAPVQVALGLLDLRLGHAQDAEVQFKRALAADPKSAVAGMGLALVYRARNDPASAEKSFAQAAANAPWRSSVRMQYVQFELVAGHLDVAEHTLEETIQKAPDCLPPYLALASLKADQRKFDDALALVDKVFAREPMEPDALTLSARIYLGKGDAAKAVDVLERAVKTYTNSPQIFYQLGLAYIAVPDLNKAATALRTALHLQPDFPLASLVMADVLVRQGDPTGAVETLKPVSQRHPENGDVYVALARALTRQGNLDAALAIYGRLEKALPKNPQIPLFIGRVLVQQNKLPEARAAFQRALVASPDFIAALEQIIDLDLAARRFSDARQRVEPYITKNPKAAEPVLLLAKIQIAAGDTAGAEATLKKVISLQPDQATPYVLLARLYIATHQEDKAVTNLQQAARNNPNDPEPLMMLAVIFDQQKKYEAARDNYEKLLALNPRFSPGLNNLAYLYSEQFNQLDKAFTLAQRARELLPNEPHAADTLGWILYKRHQYTWALSLLADSAEKLPTEPDVLFHLGMTYYMLGQEPSARAALEQALKVGSAFPGIELARHALATLNIAPGAADSATLAALEHAATTEADPVALVRIAAAYEKRGEDAKATDAYEGALKASPHNVTAALGIIRICRHRHETAKALELGKELRKQAPADPEVARVVGEVALDSGDYTWAYSLLQDAVRPDDPDADAVFAYAQAAYYTGHLDAATSALDGLTRRSGGTAHAAEAREWLDLIHLAQDESAALASAARIQAAAGKSDAGMTVQMALGKLRMGQKDFAAAVQVYKTLLAANPAFTPARRELVIALSESPVRDAQASDIATKARADFPDDPLVARACGILYYRDGTYARAASLLEEAARSRETDAVLRFYLGLAQSELKSWSTGAASLNRALQLGLPPDLAAKAQAALASTKK